MTEEGSANPLPIPNPHSQEVFDVNAPRNVQNRSSTANVQGEDNSQADRSANTHENQNPEHQLEVKTISKRNKIICAVVLTMLLLGGIAGVVVSIYEFKHKPTFTHEITQQINIPATGQTIKVHSWTHNDPHTFSSSQQHSGQAVSISQGSFNRRLQESTKQESTTKNKGEKNELGYLTWAQCGITIKKFNRYDTSVEICLHKLLICLQKQNPEQAGRLLAESSLRRLQTSTVQDEDESDQQFMTKFQKIFAEETGRKLSDTAVAHIPSFRGHEENGQYVIEHNDDQSSRLLHAGRMLSWKRFGKWLQRAGHKTAKVIRKGIKIFNDVENMYQLYEEMKFYNNYQPSYNQNFNRLRLLTENDNKLKSNDERLLAQTTCWGQKPVYLTPTAVKTLRKCTVQGKYWLCTQKQWFDRENPFKRSQECKKKQSWYKLHHRYVAYFTSWEKVPCY